MNIRQVFLLTVLAGLWPAALLSATRPPNAPAECISRAEAKYPSSLIDSLSRGFVSFWMVVGEDGQVRSVRVLRATHPDFVLPAMQAVHKWKFLPALKDGQPVESAGIQNLWFDIHGHPGISIADFAFGIKPVPRSKLPKEQRYDVAPEVLTVVNPVYPYEMAVAAVKGTAKVEFELDANGRVRQVSAVEATHPELVASLQAMLDACVIHPARKDGLTIGSKLTRAQKFGPGENLLHFDKQTKMILAELRSNTPAIVGIDQLDRPLQPLHQPAPVYPYSRLKESLTGEAVIECIIDHHGRAQLPRIVSATHRDFGWAAATAVQQWLFQPPTKDGKNVFARITIPIGFESKPTK